MVTEITKATPRQIREVLNLLVSGVTSDASSMKEIAGSWWRRLLFMHWFGPRFLGNQMDTFVATRGERIIGFVIVQYDGDSAGVFDWAFVEPLTVEENRDEFADLIDAALDHVEEQGLHPYFYFGFATASPAEVGDALEEIGLRSADYQTTQMVGTLPLAETSALPDGFRLSARISARFGSSMAELLPSAYPDAATEEVEMIASIHTSTLRSSKVFVVLEDESEVGFVQQFRWRDELRLLVALPPRLWGSDSERLLVAYLAQVMQRNNRRLRLRTFSQGHLDAARESFARLGLTWEQAPWQRWIVALGGDQVEGEPDSEAGEHSSIWPQPAPRAEEGFAADATDQAAETDRREADAQDEGRE